MNRQVLITGGAGFIGSHVADELLRNGYGVRVLDNLSAQVHGLNAKRPTYLDPNIELAIGDVRDPGAVSKALAGIDAVLHFAAAVGVGQSMYQVANYVATNSLGTAVLLEALIKEPVARLVVASSMSLYGEGLYKGTDGTFWWNVERTTERLREKDWELRTPSGEVLTPVPTPETKPASASSVYALSKYDQERMSLLIGSAYGIPTVALRFFNVYGPRQALSNPYTGALAIFAARLLNGNSPLIYEDGGQRRDFVHVADVAKAARLAVEVQAATNQVFNVGSGQHLTIREIAESMAQQMGKSHLEPTITLQYRVGDVRHCFADIGLARRVLGFEPRVNIHEGLTDLGAWLTDKQAVDSFATAQGELESRRLAL
jgi:dTDP-L-rhamnose 4-epimerase